MLFGSFIWIEEPPVSPGAAATCPQGHQPADEGCGCGFHFTTWANAVDYPGAGICPVLEVEPLGRSQVSGECGRSERLRVVRILVPAVCSRCHRRADPAALNPVVAGGRVILSTSCTPCRQPSDLALPGELHGVRGDRLDDPDSDLVRDRLVRDLANCDTRKAWWMLRALQGA